MPTNTSYPGENEQSFALRQALQAASDRTQVAIHPRMRSDPYATPPAPGQRAVPTATVGLGPSFPDDVRAGFESPSLSPRSAPPITQSLLEMGIALASMGSPRAPRGGGNEQEQRVVGRFGEDRRGFADYIGYPAPSRNSPGNLDQLLQDKPYLARNGPLPEPDQMGQALQEMAYRQARGGGDLRDAAVFMDMIQQQQQYRDQQQQAAELAPLTKLNDLIATAANARAGGETGVSDRMSDVIDAQANQVFGQGDNQSQSRSFVDDLLRAPVGEQFKQEVLEARPGWRGLRGLQDAYGMIFGADSDGPRGTAKHAAAVRDILNRYGSRQLTASERDEIEAALKGIFENDTALRDAFYGR